MKDYPMSNNNEDSKKYELMVIINSDLTEEKITQKIEEIKKQINSHQGELFGEEIWGLRDLAYKVKKQLKGYYVVMYFEGDSTRIKELSYVLSLDKEILRHLLLNIPAKYEIVNFKEKWEKEAAAIKEEEAKQEIVREEKSIPIEEKPEEEEKKIVVKKTKAVKEVEPEEVEEEEEKQEEQPAEIEEKEKPEEEEKKDADLKKVKKTEDIIKEEKKHKEKLDALDDKLKQLVDNPDIKID